MENKVMMANKENKGQQVIQENVSTYLEFLDLEKKEIGENQVSVVFPAEMVSLEPPDLKEDVADLHGPVGQADQVNQESPVKMVNQENQEFLVVRDRKGKPLNWKNLRIKLLMVSNLFARN